MVVVGSFAKIGHWKMTRVAEGGIKLVVSSGNNNELGQC